MQERRPPKERDHGKAREREDRPVSFDHERLTQTPEESQKRLFASRRRQAKKQSRREKRSRLWKTVIIPAIIVVVMAALSVAAVRNWHRANKEAEEKLAREAKTREERVKTRSVLEAPPSEVEAARNRYLNRDVMPQEADADAPQR